VDHPAEPADHPGALGDEVIAVVGEPPDLQRRPAEPGGGQPLLAQRGPRDRQRVDRVGLAALAAPLADSGHQLRRHEHHLFPGRQQLPDQPAGHVPHILDRPHPVPGG
jgi:hypothetical protein